MTFTSALQVVRQLSPQERVQLIHVMLDELTDEEQEAPLELTDADKAELDRRIAAVDANPDAGVPFEQVWARARARHGR